MKKKKNNLKAGWILLLPFLLLGACTRAEIDGEKPVPAGGETVEAHFTLKVLDTENPYTKTVVSEDDMCKIVFHSGNRDTLQTRANAALTETQERKINNLWVGQYVGGVLQNTGMEGQYIEDVDLTFIRVLLKASTGKSTVYMIANMGNLGAPDEATLKTSVREYEISDVNTDVDKAVRAGTGLLMEGKWEGAVTGGETGVPFEKVVGMRRTVAKVSLRYLIQPDKGCSFTPTSLTLENVPDRSAYIEPEGQVAGTVYKTVDASGYSGGIEYWYVPENKAGIGTTETSIKDKVAEGVTNAMYICMKGNAVQNEVTYNDVTFRLYLGGLSFVDYNVLRNNLYSMDITIKGIDFNDKRVTVGEEAMEGSLSLTAGKGAKANWISTIQPGRKWTCELPGWLTASGTGVSTNGTTAEGSGPGTVVFETLSVNPSGNSRSAAVTVKAAASDAVTQEITINQDGAILGDLTDNNSGGSYVKGTKGVITIGESTAGLAWTAPAEGLPKWIKLSGNTGNWSEADGADRVNYEILATNPFSKEQSCTIHVYGGDDKEDTDTGLSKSITITQPKADVRLASSVEKIDFKGETITITVTTAEGLNWAAESDDKDNFQLQGNAGEGSGTITLVVKRNSGKERQATITVSPQGAIDHGGSGGTLSVKITLTQEGGNASLQPGDPGDNSWNSDFKK
ncbi:MAG: BACON domain-containing protein [Parabacteroides gordonii]|uniref:BACON domain-containing protein n=1 Tax=Parabacteroides gordonii TaxID=574930 RepID=UPI003A850962